MRFLVEKSRISGKIAVPGSKSHTIRAIVIASLAEGVSEIESPLDSEDTQSAVRMCRALGAKIETGQTWRVTGTGGKITAPGEVIDVVNSGTSLRIGMGTAALGGGTTEFTGDAQIRSRPVGPLIDSLNDLGAKVVSKNNNGMAPLSVTGKLKGGCTSIECPTSQFLTSLLISCPLAENDTEIEVTQLNERPYVDITLKWLYEQGIEYERDGWDRFKIKGNQKYSSFRKKIPADFSSATFFLCAGAITGENVALKGLDMHDTQGDKVAIKKTAEQGKMKFECPFCGNKHSCALVYKFDEYRCDCGHPLNLRPLRKLLRREARRKMKIIKTMADRVCRHILRSDYPGIDIEIEKGHLRDKVVELFPDRIELYEMIYESRFNRLWRQFRVN